MRGQARSRERAASGSEPALPMRRGVRAAEDEVAPVPPPPGPPLAGLAGMALAAGPAVCTGAAAAGGGCGVGGTGSCAWYPGLL